MKKKNTHNHFFSGTWQTDHFDLKRTLKNLPLTPFSKIPLPVMGSLLLGLCIDTSICLQSYL
jgi:hypothetical protein